MIHFIFKYQGEHQHVRYIFVPFLIAHLFIVILLLWTKYEIKSKHLICLGWKLNRRIQLITYASTQLWFYTDMHPFMY